MRRGELYRLCWQEFNFDLGIITIPRSKHGERRYIPINSGARIALERLRQRKGQTIYVLPGPEGQRNKDPRRTFELAVKEAGVALFRYHDIRHTFASRLVMAAVVLRTVQKLMRHKTIAMTVRYSHLTPSHQKDAIERLVSLQGMNVKLVPTDTKTDTSDFGKTLEKQGEISQVH
jgi:integrase